MLKKTENFVSFSYKTFFLSAAGSSGLSAVTVINIDTLWFVSLLGGLGKQFQISVISLENKNQNNKFQPHNNILASQTYSKNGQVNQQASVDRPVSSLLGLVRTHIRTAASMPLRLSGVFCSCAGGTLFSL